MTHHLVLGYHLHDFMDVYVCYFAHSPLAWLARDLHQSLHRYQASYAICKPLQLNWLAYLVD